MTDPRAMADTLIEAEQTRTPVPPFTRTNPFLGIDVAYKAQQLFVEHRLKNRERLIGLKLGLTSRVKREALGINEPVYGRLTSAMVRAAGEPLLLEKLIAPRAEPELAFLIDKDMSGPVTTADALAGTSAVLAAVEIMDSRYCEPFRLPDSVADNAGAARVVLGSQPRRPSELEDLALIGCVFRSRGRIVGTAAGGAVMGDPSVALAWLINTLTAQGEYLPAGSLVLSGGLTSSVPLVGQPSLAAEFDGLGTVEIHA